LLSTANQPKKKQATAASTCFF